MWPCLHDEGYAYLAPTQLMLRRACGIAYNVAAEREFAETKLQLHHPASCVVGMGLPARPNSEQPNTAASRFRKSTGIKDPFLLYAGRNSEAKNVPLLLEFFARFKARHTHPLKLVLMGSKNNVDQPDVISIGVRDEQDKFDAYAAALALCQPSLNESLSIVMMEAWQMGTPAFVHRDCAVTRAHVIQSNGGLYFGNYVEFESALEFMLSSPELCAAMGQAGQRYVSAQYSWSAVMQRFQTGLQIWREAKHHYGRN